MGVALTVDVTFRRVESRSAMRKQGEVGLLGHHDFYSASGCSVSATLPLGTGHIRSDARHEQRSVETLNDDLRRLSARAAVREIVEQRLGCSQTPDSTPYLRQTCLEIASRG